MPSNSNIQDITLAHETLLLLRMIEWARLGATPAVLEAEFGTFRCKQRVETLKEYGFVEFKKSPTSGADCVFITMQGIDYLELLDAKTSRLEKLERRQRSDCLWNRWLAIIAIIISIVAIVVSAVK